MSCGRPLEPGLPWRRLDQQQIFGFLGDLALPPIAAGHGDHLHARRQLARYQQFRDWEATAWALSDDPAVFVANALSPAQVISVDIDEEHRIASVTVPERMLSLAIGREGQNARLAARLTGWRIDIKSETQQAEEGRGATRWKRRSSSRATVSRTCSSTASRRSVISAASSDGRSIQARSRRLPMGVRVSSSARKSVTSSPELAKSGSMSSRFRSWSTRTRRA